MIWLREAHDEGMIIYALNHKGHNFNIVFPHYFAAALGGSGSQFHTFVSCEGELVSEHTVHIKHRENETILSGMPRHSFMVEERSFFSKKKVRYMVLFRGTPIRPKFDVYRERKIIARNYLKPGENPSNMRIQQPQLRR
ncbi:MAG: hypothetical protein KGY80_00075 [Candidatus Thorarchaeota archaeon]|nr:hypothetical protein [Candidatus Thorarchaeota archaeon]